MDTDNGSARLRTGETVRLKVIQAPNPDWALRLESLLRHKGDPWNWQNSELLNKDCGLEARFHLLVRDDSPFANVLIIENGGFGVLGHVWTDPKDRSTGACSILMDRALRDFDQRGGRVLILGAEYGSPAWHLYQRRGFVSIEERSGFMERYTGDRAKFEDAWFSAADLRLEPFDWPHLPALSALFISAHGGAVRSVAGGLFGRHTGEGASLELLHKCRKAPDTCSAWALRTTARGAVLGFASRMPHPLWPNYEIVDLFFHPNASAHAKDLLEAAKRGISRPLLAFSDPSQTSKRSVLTSVGFRPLTVLASWHNGLDIELWRA